MENWRGITPIETSGRWDFEQNLVRMQGRLFTPISVHTIAMLHPRHRALKSAVYIAPILPDSIPFTLYCCVHMYLSD